MPREKPNPIFCGTRVEHPSHTIIKSRKTVTCQGYVSPLKKDPDNVDDLNRLWLPLAPFRLKLAALAKEGNEEYPVGEILLIMKELIVRESKFR